MEPSPRTTAPPEDDQEIDVCDDEMPTYTSVEMDENSTVLDLKIRPKTETCHEENCSKDSDSMDCQSDSDSEKGIENKDPKNGQLDNVNDNVPKLTNFFIENILKPDFGRKSAFTRTKPDSDEGSESEKDYQGSGKQRGGSPQDASLWPAWVYCTRYSDRPSSGPRTRKIKKKEKKADEKRPRTAFTNDQLQRLKKEFEENRYLTEQRRQDLARDLKLNESQIKIWFQNKRAKMKKANGLRNPLAIHLMAQGLYNHTTVEKEREEMDARD